MMTQISKDQPEVRINFLNIIGLLNRQKWLIIVISIAGSIGVFLFALLGKLLPPEKSFFPDYYIPQAQVFVNITSTGGLTELLKSAGLSNLSGIPGVGTGGPTAVGMAKKISTTGTFFGPIDQEFGFTKRYGPLKAGLVFIRSLLIWEDPTSGMITIGYKSIDPEQATEIVNRVVERLEEQFAIIYVDRNRIQLSLLDKKLKDVQAEMIELQDKLDAMHKKYSTFDVSTMAKEQATKIASLRAQLLQKNLEIDSYMRNVGIEDPALKRLKVERDSFRDSIKRMENGYQQDGIIVPSENELPELVLQYTKVKSDFDVQRRIFETLIQQYETIKLQVESVPPTFQIYERAAVPMKEGKAGPSRSRFCMVGAAASFFFGILLAFIVDYFQRKLKNPANVEKIRGVHDES